MSAPISSATTVSSSATKVPQAATSSGDDMGIDSDLQALDNLRKM